MKRQDAPCRKLPRSRILTGGAALLVFVLLVFRAAEAAAPGSPMVSNIQFRAINGRILVSYDLAGPEEATYRVVLTLKKGSDSTYSYTPRALSGDFGMGKFAGVGRQIVWQMDREFPQGLPGSDYFFLVRADLIGKSSGPSMLTILGAGVAVIGGATAYFVLSGGQHKSAPSTPAPTLPPPPGRPQ